VRDGRASRTAEQNALFRALEAAQPASRDWIPRLIDRRWPGPRSCVVARTRLLDDWIAVALEAPVEQVVILGAGFDTRAYRLPALRGRAVFEVDHPDTQAAKRRQLERALGCAPRHVRFVALDFQRGDLATALGAAGFRESGRSLVLWEGTTNYLTEAAVDATLRWCARAAPGSRLLFTYVHRDIL
jgi:methyltransferase (TIGR00027 family)